MDDLDIEEASDEEVEQMTAAEALAMVEKAWLNEKFSPELLPHKQDLVDVMLDQLNDMEKNISRAKKGDLKVSIHKMEIDRIRYVLASFLRIRLEKIEKFVHHLLEEEAQLGEDVPSRMSPEELQHAKNFAANMETLFNDVVLRHMPRNLKKLEGSKVAVGPYQDSYVFLQVQEQVDQVMVDTAGDQGDEAIDLEKGSQHIMRYRVVAPLITNDAVTLI
ncbi:DNA replication complex GINS protein SLD5-like [Branchiostoma lanceolatum]|uniref:DNA replication complex GINS protein SLD5 n=1 Tax=Branchiostoma lanceolatum TaxID=7740 RepID=A0A8J9ZLT6_BRALA|nr:GINS4 [Branchiostoma lanceolatum]